MLNYILKIDEHGEVRYLMKQTNCAVAGKMPFDSAMHILKSGGKIRASEIYEGFPITSDNKYFFEGEYEEDETAIELGADGLPIPAKGEKPTRKKRMKDVVCE